MFIKEVATLKKIITEKLSPLPCIAIAQAKLTVIHVVTPILFLVKYLM